MVLNVNGGFDVFEKVNNIPSLIQKMFDIATKAVHCNELNYCISFLSCSTQLSNTTRQNIMRKHQSNVEKKANGDKCKFNHMSTWNLLLKNNVCLKK